MPSPSASGRSPLLVSSAIAVVITRVTPSMLPPTMMTAPTSDAARPKPASTTVSSDHRVSHSSVSVDCSHDESRLRSCSRYSIHASSTIWRVSAATIGDDQHRLRDDHRLRREQQTHRTERSGARQQQVDEQPHHDGRQAHRGVQRHDQRAAAGKATDRNGGAERQADDGRAQRRREADAERQRRRSR